MKEMLEAASSAVISTMETYFHRHGRLVASYPLTTILASVAICGVFGIGLINFHEEKNMVRLWLPQDSEFVGHTTWLWEHGPTDSGYRWGWLYFWCVWYLC